MSLESFRLTIGRFSAEFATALASLQAEIGNIKPDAQGYGYEYVTLHLILVTFKPVLAKHGFALIQFVAENGGKAELATLLAFKTGEFIAGSYPLVEAGIAKANSAQQIGAAITYARRYSICAILNIAADPDDDAASVGKPVNKPIRQAKGKPVTSQSEGHQQAKEGLTSRLKRVMQAKALTPEQVKAQGKIINPKIGKVNSLSHDDLKRLVERLESTPAEALEGEGEE